MARHKAHTPTRIGWKKITVISLIAVVLTIGLYLTFAPASLIPLPQQERECVPTQGGTLRVHTTDCGTLYVRGHVDVEAWTRYTVRTTGQLAWSFTENQKQES